MRRMIEAAELKNQRTIAPEAHSMHLTPDTDPASTFRLRNLGNRPRLDQLQFGTTSPPGSAQAWLGPPLCPALRSVARPVRRHAACFLHASCLMPAVKSNSRARADTQGQKQAWALRQLQSGTISPPESFQVKSSSPGVGSQEP